MSIEKVRAYFEHFGIADRIREFDVSSATGVGKRRTAEFQNFEHGVYSSSAA